MSVDLSYCIVGSGQADLLSACLDAIAVELDGTKFSAEVIVLDNCSQDGSVELAQAHSVVDRVIDRERRIGKADNDTLLLKEAKGKYCLLLNADSELLPGASAALLNALDGDPTAGAAGARLFDPDGVAQPCAWRFPGVLSTSASLFALHKLLVVQSRGTVTRRVDWAQSAALLVRRDAAAKVGYLDSQFFVYSDEVDLQKRMTDAGFHTLYVPSAQAIHHEQLVRDDVPERRIIEFSRNRDRYMRKHHGAVSAALVRWITAATYLLRAGAATVIPGHNPQRYLTHVRATLHPNDGNGLREGAEQFNASLTN